MMASNLPLAAASAARVVVFGGYGVFGAQVVRALNRWRVPLTIAGRDGRRAEVFARSLPGDCRHVVADVTAPASCRAALAGHAVAVNCTGPFEQCDATLLEACVAEDCHYADLADHRGYAALVRSLGPRFARRGLAAVYGCSSLPGISGALALAARDGTTAAVDRVRATLFIGNRNPKGQAAVRTLLAVLGTPIAAPQGTLLGFHDREVVPLPPPFGRRGVYNVESPEYDLFPRLLGARAVTVKVGFELRLATWTFALMARLGRDFGPSTAKLLELPGRLCGRLGCSGGAVMAELFLADGAVRRAALVGAKEGQRMAALPCALVAKSLCDHDVAVTGAATAYEFLGGRELLRRLVDFGFQFHLSVDERGAGRPNDPAPGRRVSPNSVC